MTNEALFLHFDEQLTSGVHLQPAYDENDLVFWLHFYSLFFDKLYIPANQLTDATPSTLKALELCGIADRASVIHMPEPDGPITILWDESRFPWLNFRTLFAETAADPMYCTARDPEVSERAAALCDDVPLTVKRVNMTAELDPKESIAQLKSDVFNATNNRALKKSQLDRLRRCLRMIEKRQDSIGGRKVYSRNFYYAAFGYGRSPQMTRLADNFADIIAEYRPLTSHFLRGVDYVSHSLKALFASKSLSELEQRYVNIDVLMPDEYSRWVLPPAKAGYAPIELVSSRSVLGEPQPHPIAHTLDRNAIVRLTAQQLRGLKRSTEYRAFRDAIYNLREPVGLNSETDWRKAEGTLNCYLNLVAKTLKPIRGHYRAALPVIARCTYIVASLAAILVYTTFGTSSLPQQSPPDPTLPSKVVEIFARMFSSTALDRSSGVSPQQLPATIRLGEDIRVRL